MRGVGAPPRLTGAVWPSARLRVRVVGASAGRLSPNVQLDILDDTRIHNESYSLARKMAADALDVEVPPDELETSSEIVEQLFDRNEPQLCVA